MLCPVNDPGFADSPLHGRVAQAPIIGRAIELCRSTRGIAVDVGAHIGIWSVALARHFERVHAFEPVPENYECLLDNVAGLRVSVHPGIALGFEEGYCTMRLPEHGNSGMWNVSANAPGRVIPVHTLDSYNFADVGLIKIDVEGYEGHVLSGALRTIQASYPVVVFEDNGLGPKRYGAEWINPKDVLADLGYKKYLRIRKDEVWVPSP